MSKRRSLATMAHRRFSYHPRLVLLACPWRRVAGTRREPGRSTRESRKGRALRQHHYHRRPRGEPVRNRYRISPHCRNGAPRRAQRDPDRQLPTRIWRHAVLAERCWSRRRDDDFASRPVCRGEKWIGEKRRKFAHSAKARHLITRTHEGRLQMTAGAGLTPE